MFFYAHKVSHVIRDHFRVCYDLVFMFGVISGARKTARITQNVKMGQTVENKTMEKLLTYS